MKPDLSQYEDAATLNKWFINNFPLGRISLEIRELDLDKGIVVFQGDVWRDTNDANPAITNFAKGERDEYPTHMRKWYLEDTATSCIARCLILLKGSNKTAPKESMIAATTWSVEPKPEPKVEVEPQVEELELLKNPMCEGGFRMVYKKGVSATTGKPFAGYVCVCNNKCKPIWASQRADGSFYFKETING